VTNFLFCLSRRPLCTTSCHKVLKNQQVSPFIFNIVLAMEIYTVASLYICTCGLLKLSGLTELLSSVLFSKNIKIAICRTVIVSVIYMGVKLDLTH
jgi:hypothetical protein